MTASFCGGFGQLKRYFRLSYFTDRLLPLSLPAPLRISQLRALTQAVCSGPTSPIWKASFDSLNKEAKKELIERPESCLDFMFMLSLLSFGYDLEEDREIFIGKKVGGVELGW